MRVIVGLGNVGPAYEDTRHNVGFLAVRKLGQRAEGQWRQAEDHLWSYRLYQAGDCMLILPQTMMNLSGLAVRAAAQRWHVQPEELLAVCDDVNLPIGKIRMRPQGGAGGHHGLASCLEALDTTEMPRLRIGVGREPLPRDLAEFVLAPFSRDEREILERALTQAVEACELWLTKGIQAAMTWVNVEPT